MNSSTTRVFQNLNLVAKQRLLVCVLLVGTCVITCMSVFVALNQSQHKDGLGRPRLSQSLFKNASAPERGYLCDPEPTFMWKSFLPLSMWCGLGGELSQNVTLLLHRPCFPAPTKLQLLL